MPVDPIPTDADAFAPLNARERLRLGELLDTVSSRTLLHSLATLCHGGEDAHLLIATLIARLPSDDHPDPPPPFTRP